MSILNLCKTTRDQNRVLSQTESKFNNELELNKILKKVRDSYDMTKNMVSKPTRKMLNYNKRRVIDLDEKSSSSSTSSDNVSSTSEEEEENLLGHSNLNIYQFLQLSVIRGMKIDPDQKSKLKN